MSPLPRISVIVPTHERPALCIRAVRSALAQTIPPEEVLIWDDGSGSATRKALREFAALHPQVHYREGSSIGTPAVGRNRLIALAQGEWVAMLDDDDEWLPAKLERQQPYMSDWDVIGSGAVRRSSGDAYLPHVGPVTRAVLARDNVLILSTVIIRRSVIKRGFREDRELAAIADYCMWLDLADAGSRTTATPDLLTVYDDTGADRLSEAAATVQRRLAQHMVGRWRSRLSDCEAAIGAAVHISRATKLSVRSLTRR